MKQLLLILVTSLCIISHQSLLKAEKIEIPNGEASKEFELEDNVVLPPAQLLKRMPSFLAGWMQWRDQKTKIYMTLRIKKRRIVDGWVVFEGGLAYRSAKDKNTTKSFGILKIDPITGAMMMLEKATAKQKNFDTSGKFVGTVDAATLDMTGTWSKTGYARKADFLLGPVEDPPEKLAQEIPPGGKLFEETINTKVKSVIAKVANKIEIKVPVGAVKQSGKKLMIEEIENSFECDEFKVLNTYNVQISNKTQFEKPLEVKLFIDKNKTTKNLTRRNFAPAYYDENLGHWIKYTDYSINAVEGSLSFKTSHLTKLGVIDYTTSGFYTHKFESKDCVVYYTHSGDHQPLDNKAYNGNESESWHITDKEDKNYTVPYYVQDIAHWMSEAKNVYSSTYNLWVPPNKINVYVKNLGGADGEYGSVVGCIYFHNEMKSPIKGNSRPQHLKATVAHEFLHLIQDNYYVMNKAGIDLWWLEALAMQGDRMVFENDNPMAEVDVWAQQDYATQKLIDFSIPSRRLEHALAHSWDKTTQYIKLQKGNKSSKVFSVYGAGMFLQYLAFHRDGNKLNLAELLKKGGVDADGRDYRSILNFYLESSFKTNIGKEYSNFARWLYQPNPSYMTFNVKSTKADENNIQVKIADEFAKTIVSEDLDYLSAKIIKLQKNREASKTFDLEVKVEDVSQGVEVYLCGRENKVSSVKKRLKVNQSESITISKRIPYCDILVINTNKDKAGEVKITIKNKDEEAVEKEEKVEPYLMETEFFLRVSNSQFIKLINKSKDAKPTITANASFSSAIKPGSYDLIKIAEDNMGPDFSLTCEKKTKGHSDKNIFSRTIEKVSGSISPDLKTIKLLTIEYSYIERNAIFWETDKNGISKTVYTDVKSNRKIVFENLPLYGAIDVFEYRKKKNLPMIFKVELEKKLQIKKHLKSYAHHSESVRKGEVIRSCSFSHFDWDSVGDKLSLEIEIGKH